MKRETYTPPTRCGFRDARRDAEGWHCSVCGVRLPANFDRIVEVQNGKRVADELRAREVLK